MSFARAKYSAGEFSDGLGLMALSTHINLLKNLKSTRNLNTRYKRGFKVISKVRGLV
jgi:hypothetical protein